MKTALICFSMAGSETSQRLLDVLESRGHDIISAKKSKYLQDSIKQTAASWTGERFADSDAIIFVGATGIAVRCIAPFVASKKNDPAVLVIDEAGKFVISLLSGHLGGANAFASECAEILSAIPVITTATDIENRFAVDVFAKKNQACIHNMTAAKEISAALLAGKTVGMYSEFPYGTVLPEGIIPCDKAGIPLTFSDVSGSGSTVSSFCPDHSGPMEIGFSVSIHNNCMPFVKTCSIVPPIVYLGIGCKRDTPFENILTAAEDVMKKHHFHPDSIAGLASIDLKKNEPGIKGFAQFINAPFVTYSAKELKAVAGEFTPSNFVSSVTGVDNVCERSAVLSAGHGKLLQKKYPKDGVTIAAAVEDFMIKF